jgi:thioesterase domain-containing protein
MARQLRAAHEEVALVALFDAAAPYAMHRTRQDDPTFNALLLAREQARQHGKVLGLALEELRGLPEPEVLGRVLAAMREIEIVGPEIDVALLRRFLDGYSRRVRALDVYQPEAFPGHLVLFRPESVDEDVLEVFSADYRQLFLDPALGWGRLAGEGVTVHRVSGLHDTMLNEPHVADVAAILLTHLGQDDSRL